MNCNSIDERYDELCKDVPTERYCQCCEGSSGLPREKEVAYLERLLVKKGLDKTAPLSFLHRAVNFATAVVKHAIDLWRDVSEQVYQARLRICRGDAEGNGRCNELLQNGECKKCGCPVDKKAAWASEECPLKKWLAEKRPVVYLQDLPRCGTCGKK